MLARFRLRLSIAITATAIAEAFAAVGLWQRHHILNQPFFMGMAMWESTARFHVWPWPFKFAAILALPAFVGGSNRGATGTSAFRNRLLPETPRPKIHASIRIESCTSPEPRGNRSS